MHLTKPTIVKSEVILAESSLGTYRIAKATEGKDWRKGEFDLLINKTDFGSDAKENIKGTFGYAYKKFMSDTDGNDGFWEKQEKVVKKDDQVSNDFKI